MYQKPRLASAFLALALALITGSVSAQISWQFSTTDGTDEISGTFTTDGVPADLSSARDFSIQSIDSLLHNGSIPAGLITPVPWVNGSSASISSELHWNGSAVFNPIFIQAISIPGDDNFELDVNPDLGGLRARIQGIVEFMPGQTTIVPIRNGTTVPDSIGLISLVAFAPLLFARRRLNT